MMLGIALALALGVSLIMAARGGYKIGIIAGVEAERRAVVRYLADWPMGVVGYVHCRVRE